MSKIEEIDQRLAVVAGGGDGIVFYDCLEAPFKLYGLIPTDDGFVRVPTEIAAATSQQVAYLNTQTAGGRIRFVTDSSEVHIRVKMRSISRMAHFPLTGSAGFDLYADGHHRGTFVPPFNFGDGFDAKVCLGSDSIYRPGENGEREILIHFPLYAGVVKLEIGLMAGASLKAAKPYAVAEPFVCYGSSITQGGCASRPGNSYEAMLSRMLNADHINLGFSGSAKGEVAMAEYIASLRMSAFVLDYSYNAPSVEHLAATHEPFFRLIREAQPELSIIMVSSPQAGISHVMGEHHRIIVQTYARAVANGDSHVYFIDGGRLFDRFGGSDFCTVDTCHPNDLGFMGMAESIGAPLASIFGM